MSKGSEGFQTEIGRSGNETVDDDPHRNDLESQSGDVPEAEIRNLDKKSKQEDFEGTHVEKAPTVYILDQINTTPRRSTRIRRSHSDWCKSETAMV